MEADKRRKQKSLWNFVKIPEAFFFMVVPGGHMQDIRKLVLVLNFLYFSGGSASAMMPEIA